MLAEQDRTNLVKKTFGYFLKNVYRCNVFILCFLLYKYVLII